MTSPTLSTLRVLTRRHLGVYDVGLIGAVDMVLYYQ